MNNSVAIDLLLSFFYLYVYFKLVDCDYLQSTHDFCVSVKSADFFEKNCFLHFATGTYVSMSAFRINPLA